MWTLQEAKNKFSAVVEAALAGEVQAVSRRGKPAVMVVSVAQYQALEDAARASRPSFVEHLKKLAGPEEAEDLFPRAKVTSRDVPF